MSNLPFNCFTSYIACALYLMIIRNTSDIIPLYVVTHKLVWTFLISDLNFSDRTLTIDLFQSVNDNLFLAGTFLSLIILCSVISYLIRIFRWIDVVYHKIYEVNEWVVYWRLNLSADAVSKYPCMLLTILWMIL